MKKKSGLITVLLVATVLLQAQKMRGQKILVFSATKGFRHASIPAGKAALLKMGDEMKLKVDTTEDATFFTPDNLKQYKAVVFLSTTGNVFNEEQQQAFEQYIKQGGGFVGIHAATDTEYDWPWYNKLVGAQFASHPKNQDALLHVTDTNFAATYFLPRPWKRYDEWYNFKNTYWEQVNVVLTIDEKSYEGGKNGDFHPMAWYHNYDGGRAFYTALGHTDASFTEPLFLRHLKGGLLYAMGSMEKP